MIRVNLLPHREQKRKARREQFYALSGLMLVLGGLVWFLGYTVLNGYISAQESKNAFLKKEITLLDKQIDEIKKLKEQTEALLSRKQIIESLQANRTETVHLFNELARQVPSGVYLKSVKQAGQKITLNGLAQSNAKVSTLMRNLDDSPVLEKPDLVEIKAVTVDKRRLSDFTLRIQFTRQQSSEETKAAPAGRPPAGTAKPTRKDGKS
ncbi:MAG: PilN domain-containing protein [Rhodocyclaceae bacterium]|mgnify:CR=1 FL=1|nr:PilN domain-containing protein [Rhodocyclaceae bacterium]MBK6555092.1 PilN domain-containing protein [Rhodocyclaceae bacterium]MBK9309628.1 PilN domain-containing protein [Rhodocyclaceae bacterium]MBK9955285.1 PilN domain-containing protein [Rhodocyclaceae bacterium]